MILKWGIYPHLIRVFREEYMSKLTDPDGEDAFLKGGGTGKDFLILFLLSFNLAHSHLGMEDGGGLSQYVYFSFLQLALLNFPFFLLSLRGANWPSFSWSPLRVRGPINTVHFKVFHLSSCHKINKNAWVFECQNQNWAKLKNKQTWKCYATVFYHCSDVSMRLTWTTLCVCITAIW